MLPRTVMSTVTSRVWINVRLLMKPTMARGVMIMEGMRRKCRPSYPKSGPMGTSLTRAVVFTAEMSPHWERERLITSSVA